MPFVNYKTGDIVKATSSNNKCECGLRTPTNIQWVMGREKDIITFGETVMTYGDLDEIVYSLSNNLIFVYQLLLEEKMVTSYLDIQHLIKRISLKYIGEILKLK